MPTQRLEEKRVEECTGGGESESERERGRERAHIRRRERVCQKVLWLLLLYVFFST